MKKLYALLSAVILTIPCFAQEEGRLPKISFRKGIGITAPDSSYSVNFRFRMQSRAIYNTVSEDNLSASEIEARIRRLRLRIEGFMFNPKLTYLIQLSFSRGDMDWAVRQNSAINESTNIVRDAAIYYKPVKGLTLIFGQTKLPGNRQRVVSSGDQQFLDRSIVNSIFNIDRDFGLQAHHLHHFGNFHYMLKAAISTGEGRNTTLTTPGLSYTGRLELLPFGQFKNNGDYFEGDLEREEKVKVSLAGGINYNEDARRTGGQIGQDLYSPRDLTTLIFDGLLKYKGYSLYLEHINRTSDNPITTNTSGDLRYIITGRGSLIQTSYLFKSNFEIAARYAQVDPGSKVNHLQSKEEVYTAGMTKYLRGHRLKLQANLSYHNLGSTAKAAARSFWSLGTQIELGI